MDKIPFEDGTLVTAGYVEIDGTKYETVQPEYTGKTPLSAYNLKKMQDNIESDINAKAEEQNTLREDGDLVRRIEISGASKQETREGYNLLPSTKLKTQTKNGVDFNINDNKSAVLNGTSTSYTDINLGGAWGEDKPIVFTLLAGKKYKVKTGKDVNIQGYEGTTAKSTFYNGQVLTPSSDINYTFLCLATDAGKTFNNTLIEPMIYEYDGTDKPYEQYGASPSIEHESPIESVGDNIQLFDKDNTDIVKALLGDNGTLADSSTAKTIIFKTKPNTTYTIFKKQSTYFRIAEFENSPTIGETYANRIKNDSATKITYNTSSVGNYIAITYYTATDTLTEQEILDSIKIVEGTSTGAYSPHGQGSIEIYNVNKNFLNSSIDNGSNKGLTANNDNLNLTINGTSTASLTIAGDKFKLKAGDYTLCKRYLSGSLSAGIYLRIRDNAGSTFAKIYETSSNYNNDSYASFTLNEDTEIFLDIYAPTTGTICSNLKYLIQLVKGLIADYDFVEHQSQTKALYTQQPFRAIGDVKDRFVKQNGVWYERHYGDRYIMTGNEQIQLMASSDDGYPRFGISLPLAPKTFDYSKVTIMSNMFKGVGHNNNQRSVKGALDLISNTNTTEQRAAIRLSDKSINTVELFKAKLTELYNAGTPVYVDYVLATPTLIECTPEQVEVLNDIYSAYGEGMTNIICNDEIEPVIEIVKETKETVQSENDKAISALLERVSQLEQLLAQSTAVEEGA